AAAESALGGGATGSPAAAAPAKGRSAGFSGASTRRFRGPAQAAAQLAGCRTANRRRGGAVAARSRRDRPHQAAADAIVGGVAAALRCLASRPMKLYAPAKINWTLEVLGRREDGYHEVRTLMQTVSLCDELEIESAEGLSLESDGRHAAPVDDLVLKAARLLQWSGLGARLRLTKRIPDAAGLGGGSSDAAATLR